MPATSLSVLEQRLEACLIELEKTHLSRPSLPTAMARAEAGRRIDQLPAASQINATKGGDF